MAWDDPFVWILIVAVVIFLFGAGQIPKFARSLGQAKKEFQNAFSGSGSSSNGNTSSSSSTTTMMTTSTPATNNSVQSDPLVLAAQKEGIEVTGKTREQIASELSFKLNKA
jgi:sec-independent protein translocase protein TatA